MNNRGEASLYSSTRIIWADDDGKSYNIAHFAFWWRARFQPLAKKQTNKESRQCELLRLPGQWKQSGSQASYGRLSSDTDSVSHFKINYPLIKNIGKASGVCEQKLQVVKMRSNTSYQSVLIILNKSETTQKNMNTCCKYTVIHLHWRAAVLWRQIVETHALGTSKFRSVDGK